MTDRLLEGALDSLRRHGAEEERITVVRVPGSFEIPLLAKRLAASRQYDAIICLGTVIRGATPHFEYIAGEVAKGVAMAGLETGVPIAFGVLTYTALGAQYAALGAMAGFLGAAALAVAGGVFVRHRAVQAEMARHLALLENYELVASLDGLSDAEDVSVVSQLHELEKGKP